MSYVCVVPYIAASDSEILTVLVGVLVTDPYYYKRANIYGIKVDGHEAVRVGRLIWIFC